MEHNLSWFTADAVATLPGPQWLRDVRRAAFERFGDAEQPTESEEVWRYSRIDDLDLDRFRPFPASSGSPGGPAAGALDATPAAGWLEGMGRRAGLLVVSDGQVVASELSDAAQLQGVRAGSVLHTPGASDLVGTGPAADAFVELATAFMPDVAAVVVPPRVVVEEPIVIVHLVGFGEEPADAESAAAASFPRTLVHVGRSAEASVVEVAVSGDGLVLAVPTVELDVGDDARLSYVGIQALGRAAWQLGYQQSRVGRDGHLVSFSMALGGSYARLRTDSLLAGAGGTSNLLAAYFGDAEQMHDFRTMQDHEGEKTTSDLLFKGAVAGEARSVYSGLIRVRRGAAGTNAFQTNRNLVLSEGAWAHSVPNLDIAENDVRCSHASAVGPIDPDQRYYLESRGIPQEIADRLVVLGFFDDILERAPVPGVRSGLRSALAARVTG